MWDLIEHMFRPSQSVLEIVIRGSIMYLSVFVLMRVMLKRRQEGVSAPDVLLVVLIADAAQNGMGGYIDRSRKGSPSSARSCSGTWCSSGSPTGFPGSSA